MPSLPRSPPLISSKRAFLFSSLSSPPTFFLFRHSITPFYFSSVVHFPRQRPKPDWVIAIAIDHLIREFSLQEQSGLSHVCGRVTTNTPDVWYLLLGIRSMRFPTLKPQDRASETIFGPRISDVRPPPDHALSPSSPESSHINQQRSSSWFVNSNVPLCYIEWHMRMTRMVLFDKMLHVSETLPSTPPSTTSLWTSISSNLSPSPYNNDTLLVASRLSVSTSASLINKNFSPHQHTLLSFSVRT